MPKEDALTTREAAKILKVSAATVKALARAEELPGRKVGRQWRFSRAALEEFLRQPTNKAAA
jgi:excisionase family DNA binding protein